ncbi:MAG TPA: DUF4129 domain-containing protein [Nocardioidaceae bacterium]|nr:DUF4129 domain-containing protein [Nocardioidaceae bacterium]
MRGRGDALFAAATATGLVILVLAAAAGPVPILSASGRTFVFTPPPPPPTPSDPNPGTTKNLREATEDVRQTVDLAWLGELIAWAIVLGLLLVVVLVLRRLWQDRWRRPAKPADVAFDVLPEDAVFEALREDVDSQLAAVDAGDPRNGIVGCWLRLEEVVAAAGLPRSPWETSAEYTLRILHTLDVDPRSIAQLSQLYREARFSEHELDETARAAAREALRQLHSDLNEPDLKRPPRTEVR